ncbi:hypothetical protein MF271_09820 [Deinococcus sp. KNUC1210]|uniref:hypothetical protein n=1 Tax=Deinococcus sp. KNUC1210 TaxID=2917691 RepID=UPI001EF0FDC2|nr:hypothetical protein [Deinococcus sp. KNUC1210]ULH14345.1 hypothetical protein MF271_09820 [Deinococcus sp. KNUC1210]
MIAILSTSLLFASCAPAVMGSQGSPYIADSTTTAAKGIAGKTVYVQYIYNQSAFDIDDDRFDAVKIDFATYNQNTTGDVRSPENIAPWLGMKVSGLPAGWDVSLAQAWVRKNIVKTSTSNSSIDVRYYNQVRVIYKITLPVGAVGSEIAELSFTDNGKAVGSKTLFVTSSDS